MLYDALVSPFVEFAFMRRALVGALALALGAGPVGVFLMLRRMSLMGDAMAHAILPGAAVGFLLSGLSLFAMTAGGLVAGYVGLLLSYHASVPSGPAVILVAGMLYALSVLFGRVGGLVRQAFPGRHLEA